MFEEESTEEVGGGWGGETGILSPSPRDQPQTPPQRSARVMHLGGLDVNPQKQPSAPCDSGGAVALPCGLPAGRGPPVVFCVESTLLLLLLLLPGHLLARNFLALQGAGGRGGPAQSSH